MSVSISHYFLCGQCQDKCPVEGTRCQDEVDLYCKRDLMGDDREVPGNPTQILNNNKKKNPICIQISYIYSFKWFPIQNQWACASHPQVWRQDVWSAAQKILSTVSLWLASTLLTSLNKSSCSNRYLAGSSSSSSTSDQFQWWFWRVLGPKAKKYVIHLTRMINVENLVFFLNPDAHTNVKKKNLN